MAKVYIQGVVDASPVEAGQPPGIWGGGNVPMPNPPIANVPGAPGYQPPLGIWGGANQPFPTPPIYIPIMPPPDMGLHPEHPIYIPVYPAHPIVLPPDSLTDEQKEKLKAFLYGNLPPFHSPQPV